MDGPRECKSRKRRSNTSRAKAEETETRRRGMERERSDVSREPLTEGQPATETTPAQHLSGQSLAI